MNKILILASGLILTFFACCAISFFVMHFQLFGQDTLSGIPLVVLGFMLVAIAGSGMTFTLEAYDKTVLTGHTSTPGKTEVPLLNDDQILTGLTDTPCGPIALSEPEIIAPKSIVSVQDQVKATMQNKIIQALNASRVTVELNGTMDLDGNLTVPDVKFSFTNAPSPASEKPAVPTPKKKDDELHAPRMS